MTLLQAKANLITQIIQQIDKTSTKVLFTALGTVFTASFGVFKFLSDRRDKMTSLKKQLTETLDKLANLNLENAKYRADATNTLPSNYRGLLNDSRRFYVKHATYIVNEIGIKKINSNELTLIAWAYNDIDDLKNAEFFFKIAIDKSSNIIEEIMSHRNYASFTFRRKDIHDGDKKYDQLFRDYDIKGERIKKEYPNTDTVTYYLADAYKRWAYLYKDLTPNKYSERFIEKMFLAIKEYNKLKNETNKEIEVNKIKKETDEHFKLKEDKKEKVAIRN